ncbi:MAG TPA: aryl-sulfate sulfotransferase, partial [Pyrinomonadaceae bacterium]
MFALSTGRAHAAVVVQQLTPSPTSPRPVGTTITWTATATDTNPGGFEYQFSVRPPGGDYVIVRDFTASNSFKWTPSEREGSFDVRVNVRNLVTGESAQQEASYSVTSRVTGDGAVISTTGNPLVALYSAPPCDAGSMRVRFWRTGDFTSQTTPWKSCLPGVSRNFYVAGMTPATAYSMRHEVSSDPEAPAAVGPTLSFTTGALPAGFTPPATSVVTPSAGGSGQDVLLHSLLNRASRPFVTATDLGGALLWYYDNDTSVQYATRPVEGGTILLVRDSQKAVREIDLAGNLVKETSLKAVSDQLVLRGAQPITSFHHEARRLPDGKTVVLAGTERVMSDVQGPGPVAIVGDMIVVLDENWRVIWHWDSFDHLDVTRKALLDQKCGCVTPSATANDWTHANAIGYSPIDGSLLLSIRHQDWVVKIDYRDGAGDGAILWKLGKDGDFTFDSADPYPWFSHQHDAEFLPGRLDQLSLFDNGNLRQTVAGVTHNSRGQVLNIDEKEHKVTFQLNADLGGYSGALGSAQALTGGNFHFLSGFLVPALTRAIETRPDGSLAFILQLEGRTYRSFRMRDLYTPGSPGGVDQTVSFDAIAAQTYGGTLDLGATASSGLPVGFRVVSGPATLSGHTLTFTGAGDVIVQADQDGNIKYNPAPAVRRTITVNKASQTITFGALTDKTFGDTSFTPVATASSNLAVSFAAAGPCTFSGGKVNLTGAGSCTVTASQAGDTNFGPATSVPRSFTISKAGSTTAVTVANATYDGLPHGGTAAATGAGGLNQSLTVTYAGRNATVYGPSLTAPTNAGDYTASASFAGDTNYNGSSDSKNFQIAKAGQTITFNALANKTYGDADFTLSATASSGLAVSFSLPAGGQCTLSGGTVHITGAGSCTVTAAQAGDANYAAAAS